MRTFELTLQFTMHCDEGEKDAGRKLDLFRALVQEDRHVEMEELGELTFTGNDVFGRLQCELRVRLVIQPMNPAWRPRSRTKHDFLLTQLLYRWERAFRHDLKLFTIERLQESRAVAQAA